MCVILGAGASHDVGNQGSAPADHYMNTLPLANDLFNLEKYPGYQEYLDKYPGADYLSSLIAPMITADEIGVEEALASYATHQSDELRAMYSEVPPYLRDLIHHLTTRFLSQNVNRRPGCYDQLVAALFQYETLFIVLNYDTLLENSLSHFYFDRKFEDLDQYVSDRYPEHVLKIHGSTNWFWRLPDHLSNVIRELALERFDPAQIEVLDSVNIVNREKLYPAVTAPVTGGKRPVCPIAHLDFAREFISDCNKFLIIGTSGYDDDVIGLLGDSMNEVEKVHFVSYAKKVDGRTYDLREREMADGAWERFIEKLPAFRSAKRGINYDGFRTYISGDEFQAFVI